jgi:hypothetical protein
MSGNSDFSTSGGCRACGEALRGCWEFAQDDLYCGLCGNRVFQLAFRGDVAIRAKADATFEEREIWLYAAEKAALAIVLWGLHGVENIGHPRVAVYPDIDFHESRAWFEIPNLGTREFGLELLRVHGLTDSDTIATLDNPTEFGGGAWEVPRRAAAVVKFVPRNRDEVIPLDRIPSNGARGEIRLAGPHGVTRSARLLRLPEPLLTFDPPAGPKGEPPELIGYQDADGSAGVELGVTARGRAVLSDFIVARDQLSGIRPARRTFLKAGVRLPFQFAPGEEVRLRVTFEAEPNPPPSQSLTIRWAIAGAPQLIPYTCRITLRPKPRLTIRPHGELPEEVPIGGRPLEFDLVLEPSVLPGETVPELREQPKVELDPPEGAWMKVSPFPAIPFSLTMPYPVRLTLDPSRLDRAAMNGREMNATVSFVDQAGTVWEYTARFRAVRQKAYDGVLGIDWGTTNTCAAHSLSADSLPLPLALPPPSLREDPPDYEQFPSVLYVEDLADPEHPVFHLGPEARILANRRGRLECLIHSLKRRFLTGAPVYVRDEAGREHAYPVEELTRLVLLRLVELAEYEIGREVRHLGFTFPTKWPAATRRRFAEVLQSVAETLSASRRIGPVDVRLTPPDIDEANAVALNVLHSLQLRGKLISDRPFTLVAYDFGGGTIDTSVLVVRLDESADPPLTTRYIGIGGTNDFGGDEVTRATVLLLRDRINRVLADTSTGVPYELPLRRGGDPPDAATSTARRTNDVERGLAALRNWERLRESAEEIKRRLCRPATDDTSDPIREVLESRLTQLTCYPSSTASTGDEDEPEPRSLETLVGAAFPTDRELFFKSLWFKLSEVCDYPLNAGGKRFTVAERVRDTFQEIQAQLAGAGNLTADIIILAGGGCRLPLVTEMVREYLVPPEGVTWNDPDRLIYDPKFAKQRVAHGKATYLVIARDSDSLARGLARSVDVLHRPLAVMRPRVLGAVREIVVPVGESVHAPERDHTFKLTGNQLTREDGHRVLWLSVVSWQNGAWAPGRLGYFDLDTGIAPLPNLASGVTATAAIRLIRPEGLDDDDLEPDIRLELRVRLSETETFGPFLFVPKVAPGELNERLQGDCG